jgi:hypothetical protein
MTRSHSNVVFDDPVRRRRAARFAGDIIGMLFCVLSGLLTAALLWLFLL